MPGRGVSRGTRGRGLPALLLALAAALLLALSAAQARAASFPDVDAGAWYAPWVERASGAGLMTGYADGPDRGLFGPEDALTRAQAATVLWRMAGSPTAPASGFPDVEEGSWYADAVAWCAANGVVTGYESGPDEGLFVPEGGVTRAELAAMAWRWAAWAGVDVSRPDPSAFESATDCGDVEGWAVEAMTWTAAAGVLSGFDDPGGTRSLAPAAGATRAQAAKVFSVLAGRPDAPGAGHTVAFDSNGGSAVPSQAVAHGGTASEPAAPTREGYTFAGWFSDEALEQAYDFGVPVTSDVTLRAKWEARPCAVLHEDGLLSLQLGPDETQGHGGVAKRWEWDLKSSPWCDVRSSVTSVVARDAIALSGDCSEMFAGLDKCTGMDLEKLDVSDVTNFAGMFYFCWRLESLGVSGWDVSSGVDFSRMFCDCWPLKSLDVSGWDVSKGEDFSRMFYCCDSFATFDISGWDVSSGEDFSRMFYCCFALESLDISGWDVSSGADFASMFLGCTSLKSLDLSGWDVSSGEDFGSMFAECNVLESLDLSGWRVPEGADLDEVFELCRSLTALTLGEGCGGLAAEVDRYVGGVWYDEGGSEYGSLYDAFCAAANLPATFTKEKSEGQVLSLASLDADEAAEGGEQVAGEDPSDTADAAQPEGDGSSADADQPAGGDAPADGDASGAAQPAGDAPADGDADPAPEPGPDGQASDGGQPAEQADAGASAELDLDPEPAAGEEPTTPDQAA